MLFGRHKKVKSEEEMSAEAEVLAAKKPRGRPSKKDSDEEFMTPEDMSLLTIGEDYDPDIDELARLEEDFSKLQGEFGFDEFMEGEEEGSKQSERPFNGDDVMPIASTKFKPRGKKGVVLPTPEVNMVELKAALEELDSTDGDVFEKILAMEAENNRNKRKGKSGDDKPKAKPGRKAAVHDEGLPAGVDIMGDLDEDPFLQPTKKSKRIIRTKGIAVPLANTDSEAMDAEDILGGDDLEMEEEEEDDDDDDVAPLADLVGGDEDDYDDDEMAGDAVRSNSYSEIGSIDESLLNLPYYLQKVSITLTFFFYSLPVTNCMV